MRRADFLKAALAAKCHTKKAWLISAFSIIREAPDAYLKDPYAYRIVQDPTGFSYVNPVLEGEEIKLTRIEDAIPNEPLFQFKERVVVDSSICPNAKTQIETTIGNLLTNLLCIVHAFGTKIDFVTGKVSVGKIEDKIASILQDTPDENTERDPAVIYVDEYVKFVNSLAFIAGLTQLCVWTDTRKTLTVSPDLAAFKKQLLEKYKGKLHDPVEYVNFEKELQAFDEEYLKDDPSNGTFVTGKVKNTARKKMFLTFGAEQGFEESLDVTGVINSLQEGLPTDPVQFTALMNASRAGSFSRGAETVKGGVSAKVLLRSASNFKIIEEDCETTLGIQRKFRKDDIAQLVGRMIRVKNEWLRVETLEEASKYIGSNITVRSPMYCKHTGDRICQYCAGQRLSANPTGISSALTEISSIILTTFMKKMHSAGLSVSKLKISDMVN